MNYIITLKPFLTLFTSKGKEEFNPSKKLEHMHKFKSTIHLFEVTKIYNQILYFFWG